ncbi:WecB/TagA/CpsF family glycosyltransferase [Candidatus Curtissbacteria bacterium]|nr:WecB/TagA/CpsF family glycosyltransferase [Candidatus Curtissbacteria bacterium]
MSFAKIEVLGIPIWAIPLDKIAAAVVAEIERTKPKKTFFYVNAHCLILAAGDQKYQKILQRASLVYSGGFGPVLASKILGQSLPGRTPTPDFIEKVFAAAQDKGWSFYFLGTEARSLLRAIKKIRQRFPKLAIVGYHHGYFDKSEEKRLLADINRKRPRVLIVAMGSPKQEKWISQNMDKIDASVFWSVGALFDIISGKRSRGPVWLQRLGLEWLFRLYQEPRRLWRRYTIGNLEFIYLVFKARFAK